MCEQLGLEDKSELYANFWSHELGALYCPDDELCELYGFNSEEDMLEDIREIADATGASLQEVNDMLHNIAEHPSTNPSSGFYGTGEIIFGEIPTAKRLEPF